MLLAKRQQFVKFYSLFNRVKCTAFFNTRPISRFYVSDENLFSSTENDEAEIEMDNYFKIMNIEKKYDLDLNLLEKRYKEFQRINHPDKFANKTHVSCCY